MGVEERFLFDWVALGSGGVSPGDVERAAAVVADFADSGLAFGDGTAMSASETADAVIVELLDECGIGFADLLVEEGAEGGHGSSGCTLTLGSGSAGPWWECLAGLVVV